MKNVVIIGTGFALELIPIIKNAGLRVEGCIGPRNKMLDIWLGEDAQISKYVKSSNFLIAIGDPNTSKNNKECTFYWWEINDIH